MELSLVSETDPVLFTPTRDWDFTNPPMDAHELVHAMFRKTLDQRGIGLAAPQVGLGFRLCVVHIMGVGRAFFNPRIVWTSDEVSRSDEGCLSFPRLFMPVKRPERIRVSYQDVSGETFEKDFDDIWARCLQHEIDHLDGVCITGRVSKLVLDMAKKKRSKIWEF